MLPRGSLCIHFCCRCEARLEDHVDLNGNRSNRSIVFLILSRFLPRLHIYVESWVNRRSELDTGVFTLCQINCSSKFQVWGRCPGTRLSSLFMVQAYKHWGEVLTCVIQCAWVMGYRRNQTLSPRGLNPFGGCLIKTLHIRLPSEHTWKQNQPGQICSVEWMLSD